MALTVHTLHIGIIVALLGCMAGSPALAAADRATGHQTGPGANRRPAATAKSRAGRRSDRRAGHCATDLTINGRLIGASTHLPRRILLAPIIVLTELFERHAGPRQRHDARTGRHMRTAA